MTAKESRREGELRGGVVLVVDDVAANRFLYRALLEDDGHTVREAADGEAALRELQRADVPAAEVVLLDVSMPRMDGMQVLERLGLARDGGPSVLILTAAARDPEAIERGLRLGADAYLTKPVENRELAARVRAALTIHRLRRELAAMRRDQTAMLVHDLRHPLANLAMLAETLESEQVDRDERLAAAAMIHRSVDTMFRLVETILTASRLEAGVFTVEPKPVSLQSLFAPSIEVVAPLAQRRDVRFVVTATPDVTVRVDAAKVQQVIDNLLSNGLKFSPRRGTLQVDFEVSPGWVTVRVSDTGPGVPEGERAVIFDRYQQGTIGRARGGMGLGLAIAQGIVLAHGGEIRCEAGRLGGATFAFTLPRAA